MLSLFLQILYMEPIDIEILNTRFKIFSMKILKVHLLLNDLDPSFVNNIFLDIFLQILEQEILTHISNTTTQKNTKE